MYGAVAFLVWYLYKRIPTIADVGRAGNEAVNLLFTSRVTPTGSVALPSGEVISVDAIAQASGIDRNGFFTWYGVQYQIDTGPNGIQTDEAGNYVAKRIVT